MDNEVVFKRFRGRPEKIWKNLVEKDMEARGLSQLSVTVPIPLDANDGEWWKVGAHGCKPLRDPYVSKNPYVSKQSGIKKRLECVWVTRKLTTS